MLCASRHKIPGFRLYEAVERGGYLVRLRNIGIVDEIPVALGVGALGKAIVEEGAARGRLVLLKQIVEVAANLGAIRLQLLQNAIPVAVIQRRRNALLNRLLVGQIMSLLVGKHLDTIFQ